MFLFWAHLFDTVTCDAYSSLRLICGIVREKPDLHVCLKNLHVCWDANMVFLWWLDSGGWILVVCWKSIQPLPPEADAKPTPDLLFTVVEGWLGAPACQPLALATPTPSSPLAD